MVRWICPDCGSGVNGPERPRQDDVRRYCLTCSGRTGRLIRRVAPRLERERAERAARQHARERSARERENLKWIHVTVNAAGVEEAVDVRAMVARNCRLPTIRRGRGTFALPELRVMERGLRGGTVSGRATYLEDIIYLGLWGSPVKREELECVIIHELAHLAAGQEFAATRRRRDGRVAAVLHGPAFQRVLMEAFTERWPWVSPGGISHRAYEIDERVQAQLEKHVREGGAL